MKIHVTNTLRDLAADTRAIPAKARREMVSVVREGVRVGNSLAKDNARKSGGTHAGRGKRGDQPYVRAMTSEVKSAAFGAILGEYGPDASKPQGRLKLEDGGGRQTAPHRDLAKSLDVIKPAYVRGVREIPDRVFW